MNKESKKVWKITLSGKNTIAKCENCGKEWKGIYEDVIEKVDQHIKHLPHTVFIDEDE